MSEPTGTWYEKNAVRSAVRYLKRSSRFIKKIKIFGTISGAALIALHPLMTSHSAVAANSMLVVGLALSLLGSVILVWVDDTVPDILAENIDLQDENQQLKRTLSQSSQLKEVADAYRDHLLARLSVSAQVRELVEKAFLAGTFDPEQLSRLSSAFVTAFVERRNKLFNIGEEYWNFSVYRYVDERDVLVCIACRRDNSDDEKKEHRAWSVGEGHVGQAFAKRTEMIFADATKEELRPVFDAQGDNYRDYDRTRYVSIASIPISTDGDKPLGVLIATSDQPGRFKNAEEQGDSDWDTSDVLREVASNLAILFQLIHGQNNHGGTQT